MQCIWSIDAPSVSSLAWQPGGRALLVFQSANPTLHVDVTRGKFWPLELVAEEGAWNLEGSHVAVRTAIGWQLAIWPFTHETQEGPWIAPADEKVFFLDNETLFTAGPRGIHQRDLTGRILATSPQTNEVGAGSIWARMPPDSGVWSPGKNGSGRGLWTTQRALKQHALQSQCLKVDLPHPLAAWSVDKEGKRLSFMASDTLHILTLPVGVQAYARQPCLPLDALAFGGADAEHLMLATEEMLVSLDLASKQIDNEAAWPVNSGKVFMEWDLTTRLLVVARAGKVSFWSFD